MDNRNSLGNRLIQMLEKSGRRTEFESIDRRKIAHFSDKELALWQSEFPPDSPQFILSEFEWNRRLTAEQIKSGRYNSFMGIFGVVVGCILTFLLTQCSTSKSNDLPQQSDTQSICQQCLEELEFSKSSNLQISSVTSTNKNIPTSGLTLP